MRTISIDSGSTFTTAVVEGADRPSRRVIVVPSTVAVRADGVVLVGSGAEHQLSVDPTSGVTGPIDLVGEQAPFADEHQLSAESLVASLMAGALDPVVPSTERGNVDLICTVPDAWGHGRRELLRAALIDVGYTHASCMSRASAALIAHGVYAVRPVRGLATHKAETAVVIDAGASEMHATIVEAHDGAWSWVRTCTATEFGGTAVDDALLATVMKASKPGTRPEDLRTACREAKERLSDETVTVVRHPALENGRVQVLRSEVEALAQDDLRAAVQSLAAEVHQTLGHAHPHAVVLCGGAAAMPMVAEAVSSGFGEGVLVQEDPQSAVVRGALDIAALNADSAGGTPPASEPTTAEPAATLDSFAALHLVPDDDEPVAAQEPNRRRRRIVVAGVAAAVVAATAAAATGLGSLVRDNPSGNPSQAEPGGTQPTSVSTTPGPSSTSKVPTTSTTPVPPAVTSEPTGADVERDEGNEPDRTEAGSSPDRPRTTKTTSRPSRTTTSSSTSSSSSTSRPTSSSTTKPPSSTSSTSTPPEPSTTSTPPPTSPPTQTTPPQPTQTTPPAENPPPAESPAGEPPAAG